MIGYRFGVQTLSIQERGRFHRITGGVSSRILASGVPVVFEKPTVQQALVCIPLNVTVASRGISYLTANAVITTTGTRIEIAYFLPVPTLRMLTQRSTLRLQRNAKSDVTAKALPLSPVVSTSPLPEPMLPRQAQLLRDGRAISARQRLISLHAVETAPSASFADEPAIVKDQGLAAAARRRLTEILAAGVFESMGPFC